MCVCVCVIGDGVSNIACVDEGANGRDADIVGLLESFKPMARESRSMVSHLGNKAQ